MARLGGLRSALTGRSARNISWGLADQVLYSATNLAVVLIVARYSTQDGLGGFAVVMSAFYLTQGLVRALTGEVLVVRLGDDRDVDRHALERGALGTAGLAGIFAAVVLAAISAVVSENLGPQLLAMAVSMPTVLVQDTARYVAFGRRAGRLAFGSDGFWAAAQVFGFAIVIVSGPSPAMFILAWGISGSLAGVWALRSMGVLPAPGQLGWWARDSRDLAPYFFAESFASTGLAQIRTFTISVVAGLSVTGAMRGANALMSPMNTIFQGASGTLVAELSHTASHGGLAQLRRRTMAIAAGTCGLAFVWGSLIYIAPESLGRAVIGESWEESRSIIPLVTITVAASGVTLGALTGIRALAAARRGLAARVVVGLVLLGLGTVGAWLDGASGAVLGLAIGQVSGTVVWWRQFHRALEAKRVDLERSR